MDRVLKIPVGLVVERVSYQQVVTINLQDVPMPEWCLNLCLLKEKLVDTLIFLIGKKKLKIEVENIEDSRRANVFFAPNQVHVKVDPKELERWVDFFLMYYRDGVAQVDHIDVEALAISETPEDIYITFMVKGCCSANVGRRSQKDLGQVRLINALCD